jgi:hypothetical protein
MQKDLDWVGLLEQEPDAGLGNGGLGRDRAHETRPELSVSRHEHEENEAEIDDADDGEVDPPAAHHCAS